MKKVRAHFKKSDALLYQALLQCVELEPLRPRDQKDYFYALCYNIIGQQLSGKAASTIFARFQKLFPKGDITPEVLLKTKDSKLRAVGMSWGKVSFVKDLAAKVLSEELDLVELNSLADEEVVKELIKVKGIGKWTAEMFLIFSLGREDVFSSGDLGLKNAIKKLYNLENPTQEQLVTIATKWSPYRSYACRVLWKSLDNR